MKVFNMLLCGIFMLLMLNIGQAENGYKIEVKLDNYTEKELYLGYYFGDKQYLKDTVQVNEKGAFVFEGEEALGHGFYLVIMAPDNNYFQLLIDDDQHFEVDTDALDANKKMKIEGSKENELFYNYMTFLTEKRPAADALRKQIEEKEKAGEKTGKLSKELDAIDKGVSKEQERIVKDFPNSITTLLIKSQTEIKVPEFEGEEDDVKLKRYYYYKNHYFDNVNLADERLVRSPILFKRVNYYVDKLTRQHPDSICQSVIYMLDQMKPAEESFKYYLIHFLNQYAQSKIVGMDAVYVGLVEKYYKSGEAHWTEKEQLKKIIDNANTLKPILIGETAPDIKLEKEDKSKMSLHEVDADFTVLYFWDPDCGHCKKSMPKMIAFYEKYKSKGVEVFAVCTKVMKDVPKCWETIKEKDMGRWLNLTDPFLRSKYKQIYNVKSTPRIFILDDKKEIVSKRIGAEQLEEVLTQLIEQKKLKEKP